MKGYHKPVMLEPSIEGLRIVPEGRYVDATFGGGGHSAAILEQLGTGKLIAFDQDWDAAANVPEDRRVLFLNQNFRYLRNFLKLYGLLPVDGILADLGVSSHQFDQAQRGFSTRFEGPLDMRMNRDAKLTAREVIHEYPMEKLADVFFLFGELRNAYKIAGTIERHRKEGSIDTTLQLTGILERLAPKGKENKFFAQVFQALRIEVNQELEALKEFLEQSADVLRPGGRLVVISYHSLEDRLVKHYMKAGNFRGEVEKDFFGNPLTPLVPIGKTIKPGEEEMNNNNRARSARLRIAEKRINGDKEGK
ncbi:MAG: 16S rRNA (cytosine(1402)-N(4))-methyltransferase RsmH [Bacteroidales bacterium]|jgi:16S rRNA (cytosine1402-N4)-methyltransferase|nr:16S rRNA (cytosine(1402)-N(4))-methyltransferase RsmH [Bacteroidales bacterium]NLM92403.1 16S rRNA (cytosine(1402)-N(4))-methyltransferase RsmH [Bacteroidales bacterium]